MGGNGVGAGFVSVGSGIGVGVIAGIVVGTSVLSAVITLVLMPVPLFVRDGKWRKGRAVYLTDVALDALKAYLRRRGVGSTSDFVFLKDGLSLKKNFLSQRLKMIGKQVDVNVSPHRLRHTFATQLLNVGCKVTSIQKLLGHTNVNTTMTYARAFDNTIMLDYLRAVDEMEARPEGAWFQLNGSSEIYV